ncbi:Chaperone protein IpgC [Polaromonas vacuolata]|uniref:Chaperone protein IpgC n=1 Tax=Polaromonas vacuolata TaxID=37448 RepID=A0A6H2H4Z2_9BURK|nr:SycD/LcrH family type III secretion system chaperone [Polaromonas vacuolata]QJC54942.1 Chaperone protein IpgC [Polaromonas vacuolata]
MSVVFNSNDESGSLVEDILPLILNGATLGDLLGFEDCSYEALYALGHGFYGQTKYQDAMKIFGYLVMHNHLESRYISAFASSLQMLKRYEEAITYYSLVSVMDMSDPVPTFHTCECLLALGHIPEASQGLELVIEQSQAPERIDLKERAQARLDIIKNYSKSSNIA